MDVKCIALLASVAALAASVASTASAQNVAAQTAAPQTQRIYISGTDAANTKSWEFFCSAGQNSGKWGKIDVPSCWELQGYGAYTYGRFYKTKGLKPSDEQGRYRTSFRLPKGNYVYRLVFEGSMTDTQVWIDGQQVGSTHQGGFTRFAYDITPLAKPGKKQKLEVLVSKESSNASVNSAERRADWWLYGGIYRPVYVEVLPKEHIEHVSIDAQANGDIFARIRATSDDAVSLCIDGKPVPFDAERGCYRFPNPELWTPENPKLYTATFTLGNGKHAVSHRIGFRTIEVRRHDGIYLNGTKLVVKGTNRHCFHPDRGRALSHADDILDAQLIRQMNMNAVRGHYPPDDHFLSVCDSVGLLVIDELPGWQTRYDDSTAVRVLREMVERDVNHPCVFLWSNGNEGGWNTTVDSLFAKLDPQRRHVIHPWSDFDGIDTHHYPAYQTGAYRLHKGQNIFMPTEFLHGKYDKGQGAALRDMWEHWMESPLFAGAFIWAYIDEAVRRTDLGGILDSDGGNGPDGCMSPYRQPEASFFTIREVWSPIRLPRLPKPAEGKVLVDNRFLFTRLSECSMTFAVTSANGHVVAQGPVTLPDIEPGESAFARYEVPANLAQGDVFHLRAFDNKGAEVCHWSVPVHRAEEQRPQPANGPVKRIEFDDQGRFAFGALRGPIPVGLNAVCYDRKERTEADGTIVSTFFYRGGVDSIVWRQTPDGLLSMDAVILNDERGHGYNGPVTTDEAKWQIGFTFDYPEEAVDSVIYLGRGPYRVWRNRLQGQQFGEWALAYNNTVTGQYGEVTPPIYPEFKGYRADLRWADLVNKDKSRLKVYSLTEGMYLRLFTPQEPVDETPGEMGGLQELRPRKQERTMVPFPAGDISFLISIPPIQSYKPLEQLGPLSQPDNIRIKKGDEGFRIRLVFDLSQMAQ